MKSSNHVYTFVPEIMGKEDKEDCAATVCLWENDINGLSCVNGTSKVQGGGVEETISVFVAG